MKSCRILSIIWGQRVSLFSWSVYDPENVFVMVTSLSNKSNLWRAEIMQHHLKKRRVADCKYSYIFSKVLKLPCQTPQYLTSSHKTFDGSLGLILLFFTLSCFIVVNVFYTKSQSCSRPLFKQGSLSASGVQLGRLAKHKCDQEMAIFGNVFYPN